MNCIYLLYTFFIITAITTAQNTAHRMYFGGSDYQIYLDFDPEPNTLSQSPSEYTEIGISYVQDDNGDLLFMANFRGIFRSDNSIMEGTEWLFSAFCEESAVCGIPGQPNKYYLFYQTETRLNLKYAIIDMDLNNGMGGVEVIDVDLFPAEINDLGAGMEIIRKYGDEEYWLVLREENVGIRLFLINEDGIHNQGVVLNIENFGENYVRGELDYYSGKIAAANRNADSNQVVIFDFNPQVGVASNVQFLSINDAAVLEFSPDGNKLYIGEYGASDNYLYQYDLMSHELDSIELSPISFTKQGFGHIELGPNNKLYATYEWTPEYFVIENPNEATPIINSFLVEGADFNNIVSESISSDVIHPNVSAQTSIVHASCIETTDGSATLLDEQGMPPFTYQWNDPLAQTTAVASNLNAGIYSVIITDWYGTSDTIEVVIEAMDSLMVSEQIQNVSCHGLNNGTVALGIEGGTAPYSINWFGYNPDELSAGVYNYQITDSENCLLNDSIEIQSPEAIVVENTVQEISCYGLNDGAIETTAIGGAGGYGYNWTSTNGLSANTSNISGLSVGDYILAIEDENDCTEEVHVSLVEPNPISIELLSVENANCNEGGEASVLAHGVFEPFSYAWKNANSFVADGEQLEQVESGWYEVIATDNVGCESEPLTVFIDEDQEPVAEFSINNNEYNFIEDTFSFNNSSTFGHDLGIESYYWDFDDGMSSTEENPQHTFTEEGTYRVTLEVIDENDCSSTYSDFVTVMESEFSYIPNAFTPDGDKLNDEFLPKINGYDEGSYELFVFDRWGKQFFYTQNSSQGWDGTKNGVPMNKETYVYLVKYKRNFIPKEIQGTVLLLR